MNTALQQDQHNVMGRDTHVASLNRARRALADEAMDIYAQLNPERRRALAEDASRLLTEQRDEATVREHGALTMDQIRKMTVSQLEAYASELGTTAPAVVRVAESGT